MKEIRNIYDNGFVKLSKLFLDWQWYTDPNVVRLYLHLLLKANFKQNNWRGIEINIGEFVTSLDKLHSELNISIQTIRTNLKKLEKSGYIKVKPTNRYTMIKLLESDVYTQEFFNSIKPKDKLKTNSQQSSNDQVTTTNKEKKENTFKEKKDVFKAELFKYKNIYSNDILDSFFMYWTEENKQTGRARFEDEKFWNLENRLSKWKIFDKSENKKSFIKNR